VEQKNTDIRWLRSRPTPGGFSADKVDAENGILYDVVMVEEGPAKGHGVHLEADFITDLIAYDQRTYGDRGIKARFGHPGASDNTMGMQLGFFRNVRKRKSDGKMQAIADLHLLASADLSPERKEMRAWVLSMAQEAPDFIMSSIVFHGSGYYQRKPNGNKHRLEWDYEDGFVNYNSEWGNIFVEFGEEGAHYFTDLVDEGAATNNLFSQAALNPHLFIVQAETFLEEHPALKSFIADHPEKVQAFLNTLGAAPALKQKHTYTMTNLLDYLFGKKEDAPEEFETELQTMRTEFGEAKTKVTALQTERDTLVTQLQTANQEIKSLGAQITQLRLDAEALQARILELEKQPAADHTAGDAASAIPSDTSLRPYMRNPVFLKAKAMRERAAAQE